MNETLALQSLLHMSDVSIVAKIEMSLLEGSKQHGLSELTLVSG
jgi:hypothetical protein